MESDYNISDKDKSVSKENDTKGNNENVTTQTQTQPQSQTIQPPIPNEIDDSTEQVCDPHIFNGKNNQIHITNKFNYYCYFN